VTTAVEADNDKPPRFMVHEEDENRRLSGKATAAARKARGELPGFMRHKAGANGKK
jgi:hypothetical protein